MKRGAADPKASKLSASDWKKAVSLGSNLASENLRLSRRLASLRKARAKVKARSQPTRSD